MKTYKQYFNETKVVNELVVTFRNSPSKVAPRLLFESMQTIEEGKEKEWGKGYSYRLDRRPDNQGGDQLHIKGRKGQEWAYRHTGQKSEPNKYTALPTKIVKDIVSDVFSLSRSTVEEIREVGFTNEAILIEIIFS